MNIEWIREQVRMALADIHIATLGSLTTIKEQAIYLTDQFNHHSQKGTG